MPRGTETPPEVRDEVIALYREGASAYTIAQELAMSVQTVYRILRKAGVQPLRGSTIAHLSNEQIALMIERYLLGEPVEDIRRENALSIATLYQILDDAGVPRRHEAYMAERKEALDDAVTMYQAGKRLWEIKNATGVSSSTLSNELFARGIRRRRSQYAGEPLPNGRKPRKKRAAPPAQSMRG